MESDNEIKVARILKHVVRMDDRDYQLFIKNRIRDYRKGKVSFEWLKVFMETCDTLRELRK